MTAHFPDVSPPHALSRDRHAHRAQRGVGFVMLCWLVAGLGLLGSYWLGGMALQAASCLLGLIGAATALVLTFAADGD